MFVLDIRDTHSEDAINPAAKLQVALSGDARPKAGQAELTLGGRVGLGFASPTTVGNQHLHLMRL